MRRYKTTGVFLLFIALSSFSVSSFSFKATASLASSAWQSTSPSPIALDGAPLTSTEYQTLYDSMEGGHGRQNCTEKVISFGADRGSHSACWYQTSSGEADESGYVFKPSSSEYAGLVNNAGSAVVPTPNPDVLLEFEMDSESGNYYVNLRSGTDTAVNVIDSGPENPLSFEWVNGPSLQLRNEDNAPWIVDDNAIHSQIWYSENGQWMLIWNSDGYVVRINLETLSILTLQVSLPTEGSNLFASLDITNDGGQIAGNIYGFPLRLIDAEACLIYETDHITEPKLCSVKFLDGYLEDLGLSEGLGNLPVFESNTRLRFYADQGDFYSSYYIFAPGTKQLGNYIALGDSFASGEGAYSYFGGTDDYPINLCHLSKKSYPYKLGSALDLTTHSVACSGARLHNVLGPDAKQYDIPWWSELGVWTPGLSPQHNFIINNQPDVITVSMGGNDIGFGSLLERCMAAADTCFETYEDRTELINLVNNQYDDLVNLYKSLRNGSPGVKVYVVGYPKIFSHNVCFAQHMDGTEVEFANYFTTYLNDVIRAAAKAANVFYVQTEDTFTNYRICDSGNSAVNGLLLRLTKNKNRIVKNESFHPNELGHNLFASTVRGQTNSFTERMPLPALPVPPPYDVLPGSADTMLNDTPVSGREINTIVSANNTNTTEGVGLSEQITFSIKSAFDWLARKGRYFTGANLQFNIKLFSEPRDLGTITIDPDNPNVNVHIPGNIEPGFHTIHLYGESDDGESIDIQKDIFVRAYIFYRPEPHPR